jgi:SAM-dependent methyltransferase
VLRPCIDRFNAFVSWVKKGRRVRLQGNIIKVNFGSLLAVTDGWINIDGSPHVLFAGWPTSFLKLLYRVSDARNWCGEEDLYIHCLRTHRFVHHNLEYGLPFPTESVDYLFSSHVLEHFYRDSAESIVADIYRVLKKGGRCRFCVPDLQHAFDLYREGQRERSLTYFFEPRAGTYNQHRYMYDFELLADLLQRAGFHSIEKCEYRCGMLPDLDRLDNRPDETLYIECMK